MAAAAAQAGPLSASDVRAGQCADDPRSHPAASAGGAVAGDAEASRTLETARGRRWPHRAEIAGHHSFSLVPLPLTGETATQVEQWITAIVASTQRPRCSGMVNVGLNRLRA